MNTYPDGARVRVKIDDPSTWASGAAEKLHKRIAALASGENETDDARAIHKACSRERDRLYDLARYVDDGREREACYAAISETTQAILAADATGYEARMARRSREIAALNLEIARKANDRPY